MAMKRQPWTTTLKSAINSWSTRRGLSRLNRQMLKRMLVDAALINLSLAVALFLRYLVASWVQAGALFVDRALMGSFCDIHLRSAWLLTLLALAIFYASGFYTRGSMYI